MVFRSSGYDINLFNITCRHISLLQIYTIQSKEHIIYTYSSRRLRASFAVVAMLPMQPGKTSEACENARNQNEKQGQKDIIFGELNAIKTVFLSLENLERRKTGII